MSRKLYTTAQDVIDFHERLVRNEKDYPLFAKTLEIMKARGWLSEKKPPVPEINGQMSTEDFIVAYNKIPFDAEKIISMKPSDTDVQESFIFPKGRDVFCVQHIHNFGVGELYQNSFFEITYIFKGQAILYFGDEERNLSEGDICIITPGSLHGIQPYADAFAFEVIIKESNFNSLFNEFLIAGSVLSGFFRNALIKREHEDFCIIHTDPRDDELPFYLKAFTAECINENIYANTCAISLIKLFLSRSFRKYGETVEISDQDFHRVRPDMASVLQYIRNNYRDVTLAKTAEYFHYNKTYLSRFIHSRFSRSFMEIVTDLRIDSAREYLLNSNRKISDIALLVGYDSADHFSRIFKKNTGMSPAAYRKAYGNSVEI